MRALSASCLAGHVAPVAATVDRAGAVCEYHSVSEPGWRISQVYLKLTRWSALAQGDHDDDHNDYICADTASVPAPAIFAQGWQAVSIATRGAAKVDPGVFADIPEWRDGHIPGWGLWRARDG